MARKRDVIDLCRLFTLVWSNIYLKNDENEAHSSDGSTISEETLPASAGV